MPADKLYFPRFLIGTLRNNSTFIKFFIIGGFCGLLDLLFLYFFTEFLHVWYLYSGIISFAVVSVISFGLNKSITFGDEDKNYKKQYAKYVLVIFIGMLINNAFLYLFTDIFLLWYIVSRVFSSLIALIWNYTANKNFIFSKKSYA